MLILASQSPRRREILTMLGYEFICSPADVDESVPANILPDELVTTLSVKKANAVNITENDVVIGSDTVVVLDGEILGKPDGETQAYTMLSRLSGRVHTVFTGVCIRSDTAQECFFTENKVEFFPLTEAEIRAYISTGDPLDKAGAYGIGGIGAVNIKSINGDFFSVMGLPAARTARELRNFGIYPAHFK